VFIEPLLSNALSKSITLWLVKSNEDYYGMGQTNLDGLNSWKVEPYLTMAQHYASS
jgi:hypothetical protein